MTVNPRMDISDNTPEAEAQIPHPSANAPSFTGGIGAPKGMVRRDMLMLLGGAGVAGLAAYLGLRHKGKKLREMSEAELMAAMSVHLKFTRKENGDLSYNRKLPDDRRVESYNPHDNVVGKPFTTLKIEGDDDKFASAIFPKDIQSSQEVEFLRVVRAKTAVQNFDGDSCGGGPLFEEVEIMGETIPVTSNMVKFENIKTPEGKDERHIILDINGWRFICPVPWSLVRANIDTTRSQHLSFIFEGNATKSGSQPAKSETTEPEHKPPHDHKPPKPDHPVDAPEKKVGTVHAFDGHNFGKEVLKSELPVLVDFYADWCGPCKYMAPLIDEYAGQFAGKAKFGKVNIDDSPALERKYNHTGHIPYFALFKGGKLVDYVEGADEEALARMLKSL